MQVGQARLARQQGKINDGETLLTFSYSSILTAALLAAHEVILCVSARGAGGEGGSVVVVVGQHRVLCCACSARSRAAAPRLALGGGRPRGGCGALQVRQRAVQSSACSSGRRTQRGGAAAQWVQTHAHLQHAPAGGAVLDPPPGLLPPRAVDL